MFMLTMAWRNLWLHPLRTGLTAAALAVGIAALTFLSAMDDGWMQQIQTNFALSVTGHIQIHAQGFEQSQNLSQRIARPQALLDRLRTTPGVQAVTPRLRLSGLASSAGANGGALILGIAPDGERKVSRLAGFLASGRWLTRQDRHAVVVGDGLADRLGVALGDKLVLMAAAPDGEIASEVFRVRGLIHSGVMDVDNLMAVVPLSMAQQWLGVGDAVTDLVIRASSLEAVDPLAKQLRNQLANQHLEVLRWSDIDPMAQQWADFADAYTWIILGVVILVVLAEVLNTMLMSLHERVRELGLMGALGVGSSHLFAMMLWETVILVAVGSAAGFALGGGLSLWFGERGIDLSRFAIAFSFMYMDPVIHPLLRADSCLRILAAAVVGALLAGLIPAWRATRLQPVEALREVA
ncbi:MAG: ABC transporter permease [Mariprofundales bacterium]